MKLILMQKVESLGATGDVVDVKPGYARNYLLPRGLAAKIRPGIMEQIEAKKKIEAQQQAERDSELRSIAEQIDAASITIPAKTNPEGRLFGSVGPKEIAAAIAADGFSSVQPDMIELEEPLKDSGVFEVPVRFAPEIKAVCKIWIVPEEEE